MNCCVECFKDTHIRDIIEKRKIVGKCDFCSSKNTLVYDISSVPNQISDLVVGVVQLYSITDDKTAKYLKEALRDDWDIFNAGAELMQALTKVLCVDTCLGDDDVFTKRVAIRQLSDDDF